VPEGDAALGEVVGGHLEGDRVARDDADVVLLEFAASVGDQGVVVFEGDAIATVGQHFGDRALHFDEFFLGHYGAPGELAGGFPCLGCVGHGLPPPWWAWCFAASYWWLSRLDVGAKIGGPVKGVPASSLAGEDEGGAGAVLTGTLRWIKLAAGWRDRG
jgi:hypothetical protein